ncbi:hypothetical protein WKI65_43360 [Streptomyces sp. MS1.AVA.3]|uniref:hypothetical protein n=1 Tax=Streptomyces decoyicus TaxID=249567 RepID=UPI0030C14094
MERQWATGDCWLWCQRTGVWVLWLGPVQWEGQHAPLLACEPCVRVAEAKLHSYLMHGGILGNAPGRRLWAPADCWRCEDVDVPTLWVGVVERGDVQAPLNFCESCLCGLESKVQQFLMSGHVAA